MVYGDAPKFELESGSELITPEMLKNLTESAKFAINGAAANEKVKAGVHEITAILAGDESDNLIISVSGTGTLTVVPKELKITVNDVTRIYGDPNP